MTWSALHLNGRILCYGEQNGQLLACDLGTPPRQPTPDERAAIQAEQQRQAAKHAAAVEHERQQREEAKDPST
jgi:hypothetical protein